jgi:hypothetical protein
MRLLRRWKLILGLLAIFVAGVGTGGVGVIILLQRVFTTPVASQRWTDDRVKDLEQKLKLTPEQKDKIRPIVASTVARFRALGGETFDKIRTLAEEAQAELSKELTPEQQAEFNKLRPQILSALRDLSQREIGVRSRARREAASQRETPSEVPAKLDPK